jgi:LmbE family N-acetylglucosaminyl deacetylase
MRKKIILAMGAHPDDMELEAGGTLSKLALKGYETYHLVLTDGEYTGMNGERYTKETLQSEAKQAAKILGIKELIFLGYSPTKLSSDGKIISEVDKIVGRIQPDIVISHHPFDSHQDHKAAAEIMFAVSRKDRVKNVLSCSPLPYRPNVFAFRPQFFVDISSNINTKFEAIRCYKSQYEKFGSENLIERIKSLAQIYGWAMEYEFAECFEVIRMDGSLWI